MDREGPGTRNFPENGSYMVAVGMALTDHPPHRSQRAELPHWAPASGTNA